VHRLVVAALPRRGELAAYALGLRLAGRADHDPQQESHGGEPDQRGREPVREAAPALRRGRFKRQRAAHRGRSGAGVFGGTGLGRH
jgi:hypothetical protein